jgi:hypothetical protein
MLMVKFFVVFPSHEKIGMDQQHYHLSVLYTTFSHFWWVFIPARKFGSGRGATRGGAGSG